MELHHDIWGETGGGRIFVKAYLRTSILVRQTVVDMEYFHYLHGYVEWNINIKPIKAISLSLAAFSIR
jgi:hypothetical protein